LWATILRMFENNMTDNHLKNVLILPRIMEHMLATFSEGTSQVIGMKEQTEGDPRNVIILRLF
jgi:hypothetical protein